MAQLVILLICLVSGVQATNTAPRMRVNPSGDIIFLDTGGNETGKVKADGTYFFKEIIISTNIAAEVKSYTLAVSTEGILKTVGNAAVEFSTNVTITGTLTVNSTRSKAIHVPQGGIFLDGEGEGDGTTPPGQMFSKKVKTSTLTFVGSVLQFEDANGVVLSSMTSSTLNINNVNAIGVSAGSIKNKNRGAGVPAAGDCTVNDIGLQYISDVPARLYICVDNGAGGADWRSTNLN